MNLDDVIRLDKLVAFAPYNTHAPEQHFHFDSYFLFVCVCVYCTQRKTKYVSAESY
jgi:hypothetical protein